MKVSNIQEGNPTITHLIYTVYISIHGVYVFSKVLHTAMTAEVFQLQCKS